MDIISSNFLVEELLLACPNCIKDKDIEKLNTFQFEGGKSRKKYHPLYWSDSSDE